MDRNERLKLCKKCVNKKKDFKIGIICSLTNEKANFETSCDEFKDDGLDAELAISRQYVNKNISKDNPLNGAKDMFIGFIVCVAGITATIADFGYIFWGAILFGGVQFIRGVISLIDR